MTDPLTLKTTFDSQAELYNQARPGYPAELFDALITQTSLQPEAKLLEIGLGTGQATKPLAQKGFNITAVELGETLADVARRELADYPNVTVITGAFEDVLLPENSFDLIYSATAFHWIKPEVKFAKPHRLLKPGGFLATMHTEYVSDEKGDAFSMAAQPIYSKYSDGDTSGRFKNPTLGGLQPSEFNTTLFEPTFFKAFPVVKRYTAQEYTDLLRTFSPHIAMKPAVREAFMKEIADLIDMQFGGSIERHVAFTLNVAWRKA